MDLKTKLQTYLQIGIVTLFSCALVAAFFLDKLSIEAFLAIVGPVIGYYFSEKKNDSIIKANEETIQALRANVKQI